MSERSKLHKAAMLILLIEFDRICKKLDIPYILFAGTMLGAIRHGGFIPWDDDLDVIMLREDYMRFLEEADTVLDREKFFLQKEFSEHYPMFQSKLRLNGTACLEKFHPKDEKMHRGICIDIFPCDRARNSAAGRRLQFLASKVVIAKSLYRRGYETSSATKKMFILLCRCLPLKPFLAFTKRGGDSVVHSFLGGAKSFEKNVYPREWLTERTLASFEGGEFPISAHSHDMLTRIYGDYMTEPRESERKIKEHAVLIDTENSYEKYIEWHRAQTFDTHTRSIR